jgi:hypothetical protein
MPFRLTDQMLGVFEPLDGRSIMQLHMARVMAAVRTEAGKEALAAALEVYVSDPILDWYTAAMH